MNFGKKRKWGVLDFDLEKCNKNAKAMIFNIIIYSNFYDMSEWSGKEETDGGFRFLWTEKCIVW